MCYNICSYFDDPNKLYIKNKGGKVMKKKIFSLFLVVAMVMTATSCTNNNATAISSVDDTQPVILEEPSEIVEIVEVESEIESESEVVEEDPLAVLEVSEEFAKANQLLCLYRDGKLYSLGPYIVRRDGESVRKMCAEWPVNDDRMISVAELSVVKINKKADELRHYGGTSCNVYNCEFIGNTICAFWNEMYSNYAVMDDEVSPDHPLVLQADNFEVQGEGGNKLDDFSSLDLNKDYLVSWFEGMEYKEIIMKADWCMYSVEEEPFTTLDGQLTKNGYAVIDMEVLQPGVYHIGSIRKSVLSPIIVE